MPIITPPFRTSLLTQNGVPFGTGNGDIQTTRDWWMYWNQLTDRSNSNSKLATAGTHGDRPMPDSMPEGALYYENDRGVLYAATLGVWQYVAGTMYGTLSPVDERPTDLGTHDAGFDFRTIVAPAREFLWSQAAWIEVTPVQYGPHSARPNPATIVQGALYVEGDRGGVIYQVESPAGTNLWQYLAGTMWGTLVPDQRPTDLGVHDAGFDFRTTVAPPREFIWNQVAWVEITALVDPTTTLGDLIARGTAGPATRLPVGTNGNVLTANAAAPLGVDWEIPPGAPGSTTGVSSVFGRTGAVGAVSGDYNASLVTNAVSTIGSYPNPAWITSLAWSKITGTPALLVDPTTTLGDLIARGSAAPATRLAVGTNGQVLTADSAQTLGVKWATPASGGMADPTTTKGDVIARGTAAPATRLGVGTDGQVLTADSASALGVKWGATVTGSANLTHPNVVTKVDTTAGGIVEGGITDLSAANSDRIHITAGGNVGVNTPNPLNIFQVRGALDNNLSIRYDGSTPGLGAFNDAGSVAIGMHFNASKFNFIAGNVGLNVPTPTFQLQLSTDSAAKTSTSTWSVTSDIRLKQNIEPVKDDSLAILSKLDWIRYEYNGRANTPQGLKGIGLDAQTLREHLPEAVRSFKEKLNDSDDEESELLAIDYHHILVHSARAIQQLAADVERLKAIVES